MTRFLCVLALSVALLCPAFAWAQDAAAPQGLLVEPSFWVSTFVTDKGALTRDLGGGAGERRLDVHTASFNWVLMPSVFTAWAWGDWVGGLRLSYPVHLAHLDLPHGETANGEIQSLEAGPEFAYRLFSFRITTVELQFGAAASFLTRARLDYSLAEQSAQYASRAFHWSTAFSGWALHAGTGGDLMRGESVLLGWMFRFYWARHELYSNEAVTYAGESAASGDREHLSLDVYSAFIGLRLRIFPGWKRAGQTP